MQISRLFEIIYILLDKKQATAAQLAQQFEVSQRTIYRDVELLSQAGIPIFMSKGRGGGISLLPEYVLNKVVLTEEERNGILANLKAVRAVSLETSDSGLQKVSAMLGEHAANWIEVDFTSWGYFENDAGYFEKLKAAILRKTEIVFEYASAKAEKTSRQVLPLKLVFKGSAWYLYGFCKMREACRFFKLRRISELVLTDVHFKMSAPENLLSMRHIDTTNYLHAVLKIAPEMAFRVYDEICNYEVGEDGFLICPIDLPDVESICTYASSFGQYCTVVSPPDAVVAMKERLKNSLKNYSEYDI